MLEAKRNRSVNVINLRWEGRGKASAGLSILIVDKLTVETICEVYKRKGVKV